MKELMKENAPQQGFQERFHRLLEDTRRAGFVSNPDPKGVLCGQRSELQVRLDRIHS